MKLSEAENKVIPEAEIEKPAHNLFLQDAVDSYRSKPEDVESSFVIPEYDRGGGEALIQGVIDSVKGLGDLPEQIEIFGRRVDYFTNEYFGAKPETVERKKQNLVTAERNLLSVQKERYNYASDKEMDSLSYAVGSGAVSYGTMLFSTYLTAGASTALGLAAGTAKTAQVVAGVTTMGAMELGSQVSQRTPTKDGDVDVEAITPKWAAKATGGTIAYVATSAILEKKIGLGSQLNTWSTPLKLAGKAKEIVKTAGKTALSEGATETAQSFAETGFLLADGTINLDQASDKLKGSWKEFVVGSMLGAVSGTAVALNQRANIKQELHKAIDPVITDKKEAVQVVDAIFNEGNAQMETIVSKELELSSQLKNKHGVVYDNMSKSISTAIQESGAMDEVSEADLGMYVSDTSRLFADQVVAEANKRGVLIDDVIKGADINYSDGKIRLVNNGEVVAETGEVLEQAKQGSFNVSEKAIEITENADFSTLPHELSHFWLDNMNEYANSGNASELYLQSFKGVSNWLGIKPNQAFLTRKQQEKFARGYEKYLTKGNLPNRMVGNAFDEYDKWLQKVYNASSIRTKLSPEAVEFYRSMTTGQIKEPDYYEPSVEFKKNFKKDVAKVQKETKEVVETINNNRENVVQSSTVYGEGYKPVDVEGDKTKQSSVFRKQAEMLGLDSKLEYTVADMEQQRELATEFVKTNTADAKLIVDGKKSAPDGILRNAIYNAYMKQMLDVGNNNEYLNALRTQSLELTRAGQEIASQRGAIEDVLSASYWITHTERGRKKDLANKTADYEETVKGNQVEVLEKKINTAIKAELDNILAMETTAEQLEAINKLTKDISSELGVEPEELNQDALSDRFTNKKGLNTYIEKQVNQAVGVNLTQDEANSIIAKSEDMKKNAINAVDANGNPSVEYFKILSDMEGFANSLNPTNAITVLTSIAGRGAMLASVKSPILNIESNMLNAVTEGLSRRAVMKATSNVEISNNVDKQVRKDYMEYSKNVYKASGYAVSTMEELTPQKTIRGETIEHSEGKGVVRKLGRFYEQTVFKYLMGYPDVITKDINFVDTAGLEATKQARIEGAKNVGKRATEIFQDVIKVEPTTEKGIEIRNVAIQEALVATYTNNSTLAKIATDLRNVINKASGPVKFGNLLSPFVKTPANVYSLGLQYTFGAKDLVNIKTILSDFESGNISNKTKKSLRSISRNAIGAFTSVVLLSTLIDDEDYTPDYSLLSQRQRNLVKQKNGVYNSIRVGDKYISLDYFGPLAMPLVAFLEARRRKGFADSVAGYVQGAGSQLLNMPVIGDLKDLFKDVSMAITKDAESNMEDIGSNVVDFISARTIPSFVNDIGKLFDRYERDTNRSAVNRVISKIPVARTKLAKRYNNITGDPIKTELTNLFFGARVKSATDGYAIQEIDRLENSTGGVSLSDPTRYGKFRDLDTLELQSARIDFSSEYSDRVNKLMDRDSFFNKSDEDKVKLINKARKDAVKEVKSLYDLD